ncbi:MAG: hypothetical protein LJE83_14015 [Gammaproteobacteria bacterium]|nr:hypothetical protein [Gammaproteobacteria bacterium]
MTKKNSTDNDDDFEDIDNDDFYDEFDELDFKKSSPKSSNARRRHEQLKEDRRLERMINGDMDEYDDFEDDAFINDYEDLNDFDDLYE